MQKNNQEIQTNNFPPRSSIHKKVGYTDIAKDFIGEKMKEPAAKKVKSAATIVALTTVVGGGAVIGVNALADDKTPIETAQAKIEVIDASSKDVNTINGQPNKKADKEVSVDEKTEEVKEVAEEVKEKETKTVKPSQKTEVKTETVKSTLKTETVAAKPTPKVEKTVVKSTPKVETVDEEEKVEKPSAEENNATTDVVVEESEVVEETQETIETPDEEIIVAVAQEDKIEGNEEQIGELEDGSHFFETDVDYGIEVVGVEDQVEEEESQEVVNAEVQEFRGFYSGIDMSPESHLAAYVNGEVSKFCVCGNQEAWNTIDQLQSEDEIIIRYTEVNGEKVVSSIEKVEEQEEVAEAEVRCDFRGNFLGLGDSGHIQVESFGEIYDFYFYGNEEVLASVSGLSLGADILIHYTEDGSGRKEVIEVVSLAEEREANVFISNLCSPTSIEVVEDGFGKTYPLWDYNTRNQLQFFGAEGTIFIVKKDGIEYVKAVSYDIDFAEGTFLSSDEDTATVSVGGQAVTYKLAEDLKGKDLVWEIGTGSNVKIEYVDSNEGPYLTRIQKN